MGRIRHKRKNDHVVIVTSDAVDASVKQYRIKPWILQIIIFILCVIIGSLIGYFIYEKDIWDAKFQQTVGWREEADELADENKVLQAEVSQLTELLATTKADNELTVSELKASIERLEKDVSYLEGVVEQKEEIEKELKGQLAQDYMPTHFPLTGSATMEEVVGEEPICVFTTAAGAMVVATADGTVLAVNTDAEYEQNVWVDHGNGYVTVYRNSGEVKVKQGETVTQGTTLFLIEDADSKLGYQMLKDGKYINPVDVMAING